MKIELWTVATDDAAGTRAQVFQTEKEAYNYTWEWLGWDGPHPRRRRIDFWDAYHEQATNHFDTLNIEQHVLELEL